MNIEGVMRKSTVLLRENFDIVRFSFLVLFNYVA